MPYDSRRLLQGAYDLHVHAAPDVVPRAQDLPALLRDARAAGMAGLLVKDHTGSTAGAAYTAQLACPDGPRLFSAICLNPPVGGVNPLAAEAALREGASVVYLPTYGAQHQIAVKGPDAFAAAFPRPQGFGGIAVLDEAGRLRPEVLEVLALVAAHDAVLATGHISPREALAVLEAARARGARRLLVNHVSEAVPGMSVAEQRQAVRHGALIEHCLLALVPSPSHQVTAGDMAAQIRAVGVEHVVVSSDFGQAANGPVVAAFARYLGQLQAEGFADDEMRLMIRDNPRRLLADGR